MKQLALVLAVLFVWSRQHVPAPATPTPDLFHLLPSTDLSFRRIDVRPGDELRLLDSRACYEPFELPPISKPMDGSPKSAPNRGSAACFEMREMPEVHNTL